jgi:hypothetical protein
MAENTPFEPDTGNAGVGNGDLKNQFEPYPFQVKGYGFFSETSIPRSGNEVSLMRLQQGKRSAVLLVSRIIP